MTLSRQSYQDFHSGLFNQVESILEFLENIPNSSQVVRASYGDFKGTFSNHKGVISGDNKVTGCAIVKPCQEQDQSHDAVYLLHRAKRPVKGWQRGVVSIPDVGSFCLNWNDTMGNEIHPREASRQAALTWDVVLDKNLPSTRCRPWFITVFIRSCSALSANFAPSVKVANVADVLVELRDRLWCSLLWAFRVCANLCLMTHGSFFFGDMCQGRLSALAERPQCRQRPLYGLRWR